MELLAKKFLVALGLVKAIDNLSTGKHCPTCTCKTPKAEKQKAYRKRKK